MLKTLLLRKKLDSKKKEMEVLRSKSNEFETREQELEAAINEMDENVSDDDRTSIEEDVEKLNKEKGEHDDDVKKLEDEIKDIETELSNEENAQPKPQVSEDERGEGEIKQMKTRDKFFGLDHQERNAFFSDEKVKVFIEEIRTCIKEKRALSNVGLTIPDNVLPLITQVVDETSKLMKYVHNEKVTGTARQNIMGNNPEGIWTEMVGKLNELSLGFNNTEVDGYKVGGFYAIANAILEDNDVQLVTKIINSIGQAIGKAIDKAIVYGKGTKMPLGFVTRVAQAAKPSDYPETGRGWKDLNASNVVKITSKTGLELFKEIVKKLKAITNDYSSDNLVWVMNKNTHIDLKVEAMNTNMAAAIVSGIDSTMPVVGGTVEELSFMADGDIAFGYMGLYLLVQRKDMQISQSDQVRFLDDQTVFKGTARYDGKPVIDEGFAIINIAGKAPTTSIDFAADEANKVEAPVA